MAKILITGSTGMVGRALIRELTPYSHTLLTPTHHQLDLRDQALVAHYFREHRPEWVFHLAAMVGGIYANNHYPAKFIYDNTQMQCNIIHAAHEVGVQKILFPGSACTYPKFAPQPIPESAFLDGLIEPTNLAYAAAKINGIVMCQAFAKQYGLNVIIPMPTNSYGVGDNFDPNASHVIPALMKRFDDAKRQNLPEVTLWGSGEPLREFIYVDDLAKALIFLMHEYQSAEIINVGTQDEIKIATLAQKIAQVVGYQGAISLDTTKPDGAPRKCLNSSKLLSLGWRPMVTLDEGLRRMYAAHFLAGQLANAS